MYIFKTVSQKTLAYTLLCTMALSPLIVSAQGSVDPQDVILPSHTPEEDCLLELRKIVEPKFSTSFDSLIKTNGGGPNKSSDPFSVTSYNDFLTYSKLSVPVNDDSMKAYPASLDSLTGKKTAQDQVYKANKTHIAPILHTDGTRTPVGEIDGDTQYIDGYYVDTRVLTFGERMPNFFFPVKNRKKVDSSTGEVFPTGMGYDDFREYMIYAHHLSSEKEPDPSKRFLSCGFLKVDPEKGQAFNLAVDNYYGNSFVGSSYLVDESAAINTADGHKFIKGDVVIQAITDDEKKYFQFQVVTLAYDNGSDFLNETVTLPLQKQAMVDPDTQALGSMRETIVKFLDLNANDSIALGVEAGVVAGFEGDATAQVTSKSLLASTLDTKTMTVSPTGGMAIEGGVKYDTYKEIQKVQDPLLRSYLKTAIVPGYVEVFADMKDDELDPFFKAMKECPLTFEEKLQNVDNILKRAGGGASLDTDNLLYDNLEFGECVIPFQDAREIALEEQNLYEEALSQFDSAAGEVSVKDPKELSLAELKALEGQARESQQKNTEKRETLQKASSIYRQCGRALLEENMKRTRGELSQNDFETTAQKKADDCNASLEKLNVSTIETLKPFSFQSDIEKQLNLSKESIEVTTTIEEPKPELVVTSKVVETPSVTKSWWRQKYIYFAMSGVIAFLGLIFLLLGTLRKKQ